jgi:hypothetical protein
MEVLKIMLDLSVYLLFIFCHLSFLCKYNIFPMAVMEHVREFVCTYTYT